VWICFAGGVTCVMLGVLVLTRKTTSKVVDLAVAELESQESVGYKGDQVVVDDLLVDSPHVGADGRTVSPVARPLSVGARSPAKDRKPSPTVKQLENGLRGYVHRASASLLRKVHHMTSMPVCVCVCVPRCVCVCVYV
jgi:hypothetical protein